MDNETQREIAGDGESMDLHAPPLQTGEHALALAGTYQVIRRLNRNTTWVAAGLLGCVIFAAAMVEFRGIRPETDDFTEEPSQTRWVTCCLMPIPLRSPASWTRTERARAK